MKTDKFKSVINIRHIELPVFAGSSFLSCR